MSWRTVSIVLAIALLGVLWRDCGRAPAAPSPKHAARCPEVAPSRSHDDFADDDRSRRDDEAPPPAGDPGGGFAVGGFKIPAWVTWFAPQPGENLLAYRDRLVPIAEAAIAPQRARVARSLDDFAAAAHLDAQQRQVLDTATQKAATAIEDRVMGAVLSGDFAPASFKPMAAVSMARDVLDDIDKSNQEFLASLTDDQRAVLAQHPFDFADYLLFSTRWEDALGITQPQ